MRRVGALLGLLTTSAVAEPRHLPPGLHAARILEGTVRLHINGREPDAHLTLFPAGVCFTDTGYAALEATTLKLQDDLEALGRRLEERQAPLLEPVAPVIVQPQQGWSGRAVVLFFAAGVLLGAGGVILLTR